LASEIGVSTESESGKMRVLTFFKNFYWKIGIHGAPRGTLLYYLHKYIFRTYVFIAGVTGYRKQILQERKATELKAMVTVWRPPHREAQKVRRILLMKLDHIGDFMLGIPAFRLIRDSFPRAEITFLCGSWNRELAERSGLFDRTVCLNAVPEISGSVKGFFLSRGILVALAQLPEFDIAVDVRAEADSREILNHIRAGYKAGYESHVSPPDMSLSLTRPQEAPWGEPEREHHTRRLLYMLASAVVADFHMASVTHETVAAIADSVDGPRLALGATPFPIIGIHTGSGTPTKEWPLERFASLADRLIKEAGATVVLFGAPRETAAARKLAEFVKSPRLVDCAGRLNLPEFVAALEQIDLFVGNDSGTTHLATGMNVPTLCLFSGVAPFGRFAPSMGDNVSILHHPVPCAPCHLPAIADCPREHLCMTALTVDDAMSEAVRMLDVLRSGSEPAEFEKFVA